MHNENYHLSNGLNNHEGLDPAPKPYSPEAQLRLDEANAIRDSLEQIIERRVTWTDRILNKAQTRIKEGKFNEGLKQQMEARLNQLRLVSESQTKELVEILNKRRVLLSIESRAHSISAFTYYRRQLENRIQEEEQSYISQLDQYINKLSATIQTPFLLEQIQIRAQERMELYFESLKKSIILFQQIQDQQIG